MSNEPTPSYKTISPVLFIIFNRPEQTERVFAEIRQAAPSRLYVAADFPRSNRVGEAALTERVRSVVNLVDWECEVKTLFSDHNLGCKEAEASAMTWFFDQEEEGIILEDDTLPNNDFFRFCDTMLEHYRHDSRIRHICGCNLQHGKKWGNASYYFSNISHGWGWAGWRRVWKDYDRDLKQYEASDIRPQLENIFEDSFIVDSWEQIFIDVKAGKIDTWDYQYGFLNFFNNSLSVIPNYNLITNIGFGVNSTNTHDADNINANIPLEPLDEIIHPLYIVPQKKADEASLKHDFNVDARRKKYNKPKYRLKRWLKSLGK